MGKKAIGPRVRGTLITVVQVDQHSIKLTSKHLSLHLKSLFVVNP